MVCVFKKRTSQLTTLSFSRWWLGLGLGSLYLPVSLTLLALPPRADEGRLRECEWQVQVFRGGPGSQACFRQSIIILIRPLIYMCPRV